MAASNDLLQQFVNDSDGKAFAELAHRHSALVYGACIRVLGDRDRAAEATQETFFQLMRSAATITGSISGWLHRVATRKAIDCLRKDLVRQRVESEYADGQLKSIQQWKELSPQIDEVLSQLEDETQSLVVEYFLENRSMTEIAADKGVSTATISRHINTAVKRLRNQLHAHGLVLSVVALYGFLQEHSASAAPATVVRELAKMGLVGRAIAVGSSFGAAAQVAGSATGVTAGLKAAVAVLVCLVTTSLLVVAVQRADRQRTERLLLNESSTAVQTEIPPSVADGNGMDDSSTIRRLPNSRQVGTPAPPMTR